MMDENPYRAAQADSEAPQMLVRLSQHSPFLGALGFFFCVSGSLQDNPGLKVVGVVVLAIAAIPIIARSLNLLWRQVTRL